MKMRHWSKESGMPPQGGMGEGEEGREDGGRGGEGALIDETHDLLDDHLRKTLSRATWLRSLHRTMILQHWLTPEAKPSGSDPGSA